MTHTLITGSELELDSRDTIRYAHYSDSEDEEHSHLASPADLNIPKDDRWKHHDDHIGENVDNPVRVVNDILCSIY